jgi:hypothetical protein
MICRRAKFEGGRKKKKKEDKLVCTNYIGIYLNKAPYKVFMSII